MKYNPGDVVRVRDDLTQINYLSEAGEYVAAVEEMMPYRGQYVTIRKIDTWNLGCESVYRVKENGWAWTAAMFEPAQMFDDTYEATGEVTAFFDALMQ